MRVKWYAQYTVAARDANSPDVLAFEVRVLITSNGLQHTCDVSANTHHTRFKQAHGLKLAWQLPKKHWKHQRVLGTKALVHLADKVFSRQLEIDSASMPVLMLNLQPVKHGLVSGASSPSPGDSAIAVSARQVLALRSVLPEVNTPVQLEVPGISLAWLFFKASSLNLTAECGS